jgi:hypothetical protein
MNITNVNVTNVYRNSRYRNGISAVAAGDFQSGRFNNVMRTSGAQVGTAGVIRGQMPFTAGSANMRFSDRAATVVPRGNANYHAFTHQQPNPVQRSQFNPGGGASRMSNAPAMAQNNRGQSSPQSAQGNDAGGWRRFGSPSGQSAAGGQGNQPAANRNGFGTSGQAQAGRSSASPSNDSRGGWQRFGTPGGGNSAPNQRQTPTAPRQDYRSNSPASLRIASPVVRQRPSYSAPSYSAPRYSAPSYSAPRQSAPSYSAPRQSAPAPRSSGGGSVSRGSSGGGSHGSRR